MPTGSRSRPPVARAGTRAARAIARATYRSYRNALAKAYRANAPATVALGGLAASAVLVLVVLQLQAVLPLLAGSTLAALSQAQVISVGRAALAGLAATAWGLALLFEVMDLQSDGIALVAETRGTGRLALGVGRAGPHVVVSAVGGLLLIGPSSLAGADRALAVGAGLPAWSALVLAVWVVSCVAVMAAATSLALSSAVALLMRRPRRAPGTRAVTAAVSGGVLIAGLATVLAGNTAGLYLLAPPLWAVAGLPHDLADVAVMTALAVAWAALCAWLECLRPRAGGRAVGLPLRLAWLRLPGTVARLELRQMFRDPIQLASVAVSLAGAVVIGIFFRTGTLAQEQARLLLLGLIGVNSVSTCLAAFRASTTGWLYPARSSAYVRWYGGALPGLVAGSLLAALGCRLLTTLPVQVESDYVLATISVVGSVAGLVCGLVLNRPGTSAESKGGLMGGGLLALGVTAVVFLPTTTLAVFDSGLVAGSYLLVAAVALTGAGLALVTKRGLVRPARA